jgi:amidase
VTRFDVVEAGIAQLRRALEDGSVTSEELVRRYLERIDAYDRNGPRLNALVVMNPDALADARASDQRRAHGQTLGPLDGIPYTAKDSYLAKGLTAAAGAHAFEHLVAQRDAFTIERLRTAGAVLIGLTNMPPMANGGMQRGVYGRAESPYNRDYLTSAFGSGSSNGSGTATAASFAAFGLGEETWSSGRAPATNNALCAYTPSRGHLGARQLAAGAHHGRRRTAYPDDGRPVRGARHHRRRRSRPPWRLLAGAAVDRDPQGVGRAARVVPVAGAGEP